MTLTATGRLSRNCSSPSSSPSAVVVQRARILRTRAMFDIPWGCTFAIDGDDELVGTEHLERWLDIAGRRIGLGDWLAQRSPAPTGGLRSRKSRPGEVWLGMAGCREAWYGPAGQGH